MFIQLGDIVPISLQLCDGDSNQHPVAEIYDDAGTLLDTKTLTHVASGLYAYLTGWPMPDKPFITLVYIVYSNAGHTIEAVDYTRDIETVTLEVPADYMSTGFSVPGEYDAALSTIYGKVEGLDGAVMRGSDGVPTNPLLTDDSRLNNLDVPISSRADQNPPSQNLEDYKTTGFAVPGEYDIRLAAIQGNVDFLTSIEGGKWKIINNQMVFYKVDNITEVARFDLFDSSGNPTEINVMERQRV